MTQNQFTSSQTIVLITLFSLALAHPTHKFTAPYDADISQKLLDTKLRLKKNILGVLRDKWYTLC